MTTRSQKQASESKTAPTHTVKNIIRKPCHTTEIYQLRKTVWDKYKTLKSNKIPVQRREIENKVSTLNRMLFVIDSC